MGELDGKVAIVTGAGRLRGIGRAACVALAQLGADIVPTGTGRNPASFPDDEKAIGWKDIESTAEQVRALGRRALPLVVDVSNAENVAEMAAQDGAGVRANRHHGEQRCLRPWRRPRPDGGPG